MEQRIHDANVGEVKIADDVVAIIAGIAATEVEGVASMAGNITKEIISKLGMKNLSKGVKVNVEDGSVIVDLSLNIKYGYGVPEVSANVQDNRVAGCRSTSRFCIAGRIAEERQRNNHVH